jgi:integrase
MRMIVKLTDKKVAGLKLPGKGTRVVYDGETHGFGVRITANGSRSFTLDYANIHGQRRRHTIGNWPEYSAEEARNEALDLRREIKRGGDPVQDRRDGREKALAERTVKDLCEAYMARHVMLCNGPDQKKNARRMMDKVIIPRWGGRKLGTLKKADIIHLHNQIGAKHVYSANQVLTVIKAMFNHGVLWEWCATNPAEGIKRHPEDERQTWLDETKMARLDRAITEYGQDAGELIRLLLLSGARRGEWMRAMKADLDLEHGIWTKPAHSVKERRTESVNLNRPTLAVLKRVIASTAKDEPYLFPGTVKGEPRRTVRRPWVQILRTAGMVKEYTVAGKRGPLTRYRPTIRLHDLRHSYASWLAEDGVPLKTIGKLLGHQRSETTDRYTHIADRSLRDATNRFGDMITKTVQ